MEFQAMHRLPVASCRLQVAGCKLGGQSAFNYWQQAAAPPLEILMFLLFLLLLQIVPANSPVDGATFLVGGSGTGRRQNLAAQINHNFGGAATAAGALPSSWTKCCQAARPLNVG